MHSNDSFPSRLCSMLITHRQFAYNFLALMVTTKCDTNQTFWFIQMVKCYGSPLPYISPLAPSTSVISHSISKCASWNSAHGHLMEIKSLWLCITTKTSSIYRIIGSLVHGILLKCQHIWISTKMWDNQRKQISHLTSSFGERPSSTQSI